LRHFNGILVNLAITGLFLATPSDLSLVVITFDNQGVPRHPNNKN